MGIILDDTSFIFAYSISRSHSCDNQRQFIIISAKSTTASKHQR